MADRDDIYTLYSMQDSGNCYKARLMLVLAGANWRLVDADSRDGSTRRPEFLAINPAGKVPTLVLPDGTALAESNAILVYLAQGTPYLPDDRLELAQTLSWMFFEQYSHEPYVAVALSWLHLVAGGAEKFADRLPEMHEKGYAAFDVMEKRLQSADFLAAGHFTVADIALYAHTHLAPQGGFEMAPYPAIRAWLERVTAQPGFVDIDHRP